MQPLGIYNFLEFYSLNRCCRVAFRFTFKNNYSYKERLVLRQDKSMKVIDEFYSWINEITLKTLPQSLLCKAITYAINQKEYLCSFLKDGRIQLSNNLAEQSIRMFVIGRKNWLFSVSEAGAQANAICLSLAETAKANRIDFYAYLVYLFTHLPSVPIYEPNHLKDFMPWSKQVQLICKK